jgi:hypothetical protein
MGRPCPFIVGEPCSRQESTIPYHGGVVAPFVAPTEKTSSWHERRSTPPPLPLGLCPTGCLVEARGNGREGRGLSSYGGVDPHVA